jgi:hypothetical protein
MNKNEGPDHPIRVSSYRCCGLSSAISNEGYEQRLMIKAHLIGHEGSPTMQSSL